LLILVFEILKIVPGLVHNSTEKNQANVGPDYFFINENFISPNKDR